jgi:tetratricopeptide (TPR) repeat protein
MKNSFGICGIAAVGIGVLLFLSFQEIGGTSRIVLFLAGLIVTVGSIVALYSAAEPEDSKQIKAERSAAFAVIAALGVSLVAINAEQVLKDEPDNAKKTMGRPMITKLGTARAQGQAMPVKPGAPPRAAPGTGPTQPGGSAPPGPPAGPQAAPASGEMVPDLPPEIAGTVNQLLLKSDQAFKAEKLDEAEQLLLQVLSIIDEKAPAHLKQRGQVAGTLSRVRFAAKKVDDAVGTIDDQIARFKKDPKHDPSIVASFHELAGTFLGNAEKYPESIERFNRCLAIRKKLNLEPSLIASTHAKLTISFARMGDKAKAREQLASARQILSEMVPKDEESLRQLDSVAAEYGL